MLIKKPKKWRDTELCALFPLVDLQGIEWDEIEDGKNERCILVSKKPRMEKNGRFG